MPPGPWPTTVRSLSTSSGCAATTPTRVRGHSSRWADKTLRGLQEFLLADKKRVSAVPVDTALTQLRRVSLPNPIEYAETKASLDRLLTHEAKRRAARSSAATEAEASGAGSEVAARAKARALRTGRGEDGLGLVSFRGPSASRWVSVVAWARRGGPKVVRRRMVAVD